MENYIKFLGTAGARFVMIKQLRASGGLWISYQGTNLLIDPGPGSLVRCVMSKPKLDPGKLDGILLTHRHLDHANDINVMIEGMTCGGFKKRGTVFLPLDAIEEEPVILKHLRGVLGKIETLKERKTYTLGKINFTVPSRQIHPVMTYGLRFNFKQPVALISDTRYYEDLVDLYKAPILIINVVFYGQRFDIDHLGFNDVKKIITGIRPKVALLTHFGLTMLANKPDILAKNLTKETGVKVIAASDGMSFGLS